MPRQQGNRIIFGRKHVDGGRFSVILLGLILLLPLGQAAGDAGPTALWGTGGVPFSVAKGLQLRSAGASDGEGGAIIVWEDHRVAHGLPDIYGQRISANGLCLWQKNGKPLITTRNINGDLASHSNPAMVSDGTGGAIFAWADNRNLQGDIFAQRVDGNGKPLWKSGGVPIATACFPGGLCANSKSNPEIASDGAGGAIITWYEVRDGFDLSVWAQRVNAKGVRLWAKDGVPVVSGSFHAHTPKIVNDGKTGAIIAWQDARAADGVCVYAQHLNWQGTPTWTLNGVQVSPPIGQSGPSGHYLLDDGSYGAFVAWVDTRVVGLYEPTIYVQRLNRYGGIRWPEFGRKVANRSGGQSDPSMVRDGNGGLIIAWTDSGAAPPGSGQTWLYVQRMDARGFRVWQRAGIPICTYQGFAPKTLIDGAGGVIIVWDGMEPLEGPSIFAQRLTGSGEKLWGSEGFVVYHQPQGSYGFEPVSVGDGQEGVIVFWKDYRFSASAWDIFSQRIGEAEE
jgi:hypothetical protein